MTTEFAVEIARIVTAAATILALILPVVGVTGGLKGLFDRAPDINVGPWTIKDGQYMSFLSAAGLLALAHFLGFGPDLSGVDSVGAFILAEWSALVVAANLVYSAAGYAGTLDWDIEFTTPEPTPEPEQPATKSRRSSAS